MNAKTPRFVSVVAVWTLTQGDIFGVVETNHIELYTD